MPTSLAGRTIQVAAEDVEKILGDMFEKNFKVQLGTKADFYAESVITEQGLYETENGIQKFYTIELIGANVFRQYISGSVTGDIEPLPKDISVRFPRHLFRYRIGEVLQCRASKPEDLVVVVVSRAIIKYIGGYSFCYSCHYTYEGVSKATRYLEIELKRPNKEYE